MNEITTQSSQKEQRRTPRSLELVMRQVNKLDATKKQRKHTSDELEAVNQYYKDCCPLELRAAATQALQMRQCFPPNSLSVGGFSIVSLAGL